MKQALPTPEDWAKAEQEALKHFKALLRIDTTNPPGNELAAAKYIAQIFDHEGIPYDIFESEPGRASLVARLPSTEKAGGPLLLNGHLDVVPVDAASWAHPPFEAIEADGCIWGRGAIDMKNMVTMSMMTIILAKRLNLPLQRDLIFAAVADEEAGSHHGSLYLTENFPEKVRAEYVLNEVGGHTLYFGKRRYYPIQVSEKGICWFELTARGEPGHGSMPRKDNAIVRLARALERLGTIRLPQHNTDIVEQFLHTLASGSSFPTDRVLPGLLEPKLAGHLLDVMGMVMPDKARGIDAMLRNTVSPTMISGGKKVNVIPGEAKAVLDGRILPGHTLSEFLREVREIVGNDLDIKVVDHREGSTFKVDTPLYNTICESLRAEDNSGVPVPYMIPGFTDSFAYGKLGATCYGFSPVQLGPELNFAEMYHGHNERIPIDGFLWGFRMLFNVVRRFCS